MLPKGVHKFVGRIYPEACKNSKEFFDKARDSIKKGR
jgi:hypothetical protein